MAAGRQSRQAGATGDEEEMASRGEGGRGGGGEQAERKQNLKSKMPKQYRWNRSDERKLEYGKLPTKNNRNNKNQ